MTYLKPLNTKARRRGMAIIGKVEQHYNQIQSLLGEAVACKLFRAPTRISLRELELEACGHAAYMGRIQILRENLK